MYKIYIHFENAMTRTASLLMLARLVQLDASEPLVTADRARVFYD